MGGLLLPLPFESFPNMSPHATGCRQVVIRKRLETYFDTEDKDVMAFHVNSTERRSAGHPAP